MKENRFQPFEFKSAKADRGDKKMKKVLLALFLSIAVIFNFGVVNAAQSTDTVKEDKTARIFINGVQFKNSSVLILKNGTPMLAAEYFTALGINTKNQVWDKAKKKLTLTKGSTKLVLELDSSNYTLNGKKATIKVKPFTYKGKPYFPIEQAAVSFGSKFVSDADTNTYFIKANSDFTKNKQLLGKILTIMNSASKLKVNEDVKLSLNGTGFKYSLSGLASSLIDKKGKLSLSNVDYDISTNGIPAKSNVQMYFADNFLNVKVNGGEWAAQALTKEQADEQFDLKNNLGYDDLICSALTVANGTTKDEQILKGNVIMGISIPTLMSGQGLVKNKINTKSVEVTFNKNTNVVSKIVLKETGTTEVNLATYNFSVSYTITYSDINGKFEVEMPDGLK